MADRQIMVISVMDRDRPGIVAEVTEGISALGGNLADLRESVLCGYFTMILIAGFPPKVAAEEVEAALTAATGSNVSVMLHAGSLAENGNTEHTYVLSAVGRDRIGLVAQVSRLCCNHGANILDLASHVEADQYTMMLQLDLSAVRSVEDFETALSAFGKANGLKLALQHNDIFRVTNEI